MNNCPNIAVVVLDTLRYDYFKNEFDWVPGKRFTNAYSTANWTIPAHASIFMGEYPSKVGTHSKSPSLDDWEQSLPAVLQENGYRTTMFTANPNLSGRDGWKDGFDVVREDAEFDTVSEPDSLDWPDFLPDTEQSTFEFILSVCKGFSNVIWNDYLLSDSIKEGYSRLTRNYKDGGAQALVDELEAFDWTHSGEFLFVNLMDCHVPYFPPEAYRTIDHEVETYNWEPFVDGVSNLQEIQKAYADSVRYLSDKFREGFNLLLDNFKYVIVTSDHGEMLGKDNMIDHLYGLYPELTHVPLVVYGDDIDDTPVDRPVSLLDIFPTVMDLTGLEIERQGESLLSNIWMDSYLTEYQGFPLSVRTNFISNGIAPQSYSELDAPLLGYVDGDGSYVFETHDEGLQSNGDIQPDEQHEQELAGLIEQAGVRRVDSESTTNKADDELLDRLSDLGYA